MAKIKKTESKNQEPKSRKITSGPLREKARTMKRLIAAVGKVLQKYSYPGLTVINIAKEAGLNRKLIYTYFGSLDNLIETYISEKDFWKSGAKKMIEGLVQDPDNLGSSEMNALLQAQFDTLLKDKALQKIMHWGLGEKNKLLRKISDQREEIGEAVLTILDKDFENSKIDIRALLALQLAGIYCLSLHANSYGSTFCGIDINDVKGKERISKAIQDTIEAAYSLAKINK
ncbi:TetR/AcrR family transcriptional regulator [Chryseobacterium herbae]|uniref:TetR/AcrR family transcriptional regulator n=1 Tax=Chryseobacterium herbae TaxID=2976476 RepID=A0ABT2ITF2_9FLAO|nr:TetR/AcrR family transcriptional regulator [Chryseobacterium sp. pc1-10]MCT2561776.1 TetR/AcrR family transcriptional regulator [Chryseobacterium sp. pc1-10]